MAYYNLPPVLSHMIDAIDTRLRRLENAYRFNAPNVNINTTAPTNPNVGDVYYDTVTKKLVFWNGTAWQKITSANY